MTQPKLYRYFRASTQEQVIRGESFRRQRENLDSVVSQLIQEYNLDPIPRDIDDGGTSAFHGSNFRSGTGLGDFIESLGRREIPSGSILAIEEIDRFSRQAPLIAQQNFVKILEMGVHIHIVSERQTYTYSEFVSNPFQVLSLFFKSHTAHEESRKKSERLKASWKKKRLDAQEKTVAMTAVCPAWLRKVENSYAIIPDRARIVKDIFEMAESGYGEYTIVSRLNRSGVPSFGFRGRGDGKWQKSYIQRILHNPGVYGEYQPMRRERVNEQHRKFVRVPDGEPIQGYFPVVVDKELFDRVQSLRQSRKLWAKGRKGKTFNNLFTNGVRCIACGSAMHFLDKGDPPKGGRYLACSSAARGTGCQFGKFHRYAPIEASVLFNLGFLLDWSEVFDHPGDSELRQKLDVLEEEKHRLQDRFNEVEQSRNNLLNQLERITDDDVTDILLKRLGDRVKQAKELEPQIKEKQKEIDLLNSRLMNRSQAEKSFRHSLIDYLALLKDAEVNPDTEEGQARIFEVRQRVHKAIRDAELLLLWNPPNCETMPSLPEGWLYTFQTGSGMAGVQKLDIRPEYVSLLDWMGSYPEKAKWLEELRSQVEKQTWNPEALMIPKS